MEYLRQTFWKILGYDEESLNANLPRKIVAFGNVLLDLTAKLPDTSFLEKYQLEIGTKGELVAETLSKITAEASECLDCEKNPGGCSLNTVRILKKLGTDALFIGAVGVDETSEQLRQILKSHGVEARLQTINDVPTGKCICLVHEETTTLYANIGASAKVSVDFLKQLEKEENLPFLRPLDRKQILYIEGFFLSEREAVCQYIMKNYIRERRRLAFNLSGVYIVQEHYEQLLDLARTAFFMFGNENEFNAFVKKMGKENVEEMAQSIIQNGVPKVIVITKGAKGVQVIANVSEEFSEPGDIIYQNYNAPRVENVVDTTGAGDAFVAGFLHAWLEKRQLSECVRVATDVAAKVCTQIGCNLP